MVLKLEQKVMMDPLGFHSFYGFNMVSDENLKEMRDLSTYKEEVLKKFFGNRLLKECHLTQNSHEVDFFNKAFDKYLLKEFGENLKKKRDEIIYRLNMDFNYEESNGYLNLEVKWKFILPFSEETTNVLGKYHTFFKFHNPPGYDWAFSFYRTDAKREF